jgi:hypothetical protein
MVGTPSGEITKTDTETVEHHDKLLVADSLGAVRLADSESGAYEHVVHTGSRSVASMGPLLELPGWVQTFWDNGKRMVWDPRTGRLDEMNPQIVVSDRDQVRVAVRTMILDDGLAQFKEGDGQIIRWRLGRNTPPTVVGTHPTHAPEVVCGRAHGRAFVAAGGGTCVSVWAVDGGDRTSQLIELSAEVTSLAFGHDRLYVCAGGELYAFDHCEEMS